MGRGRGSTEKRAAISQGRGGRYGGPATNGTSSCHTTGSALIISPPPCGCLPGNSPGERLAPKTVSGPGIWNGGAPSQGRRSTFSRPIQFAGKSVGLMRRQGPRHTTRHRGRSKGRQDNQPGIGRRTLRHRIGHVLLVLACLTRRSRGGAECSRLRGDCPRGHQFGRNSVGVIRVESFARLFVRVEQGMWKCTRDGKFDFPEVRVEVTAGATFTSGTTFNGFDLARWLDQQNGIRPKNY